MEFEIVRFLNHLGQGTVLDSLTFYFSWLPALILFWLILAILALIFDKKRGKWIFWGTIFIGMVYFVISDLVLKQTLASVYFRERPYIAFSQSIISTGEMWVDSSFPSGHMSATAALLTLYLYFYRRKTWVWLAAIFFALLMAFARLHNGMHYPGDVLAGALFGIGYGFLAIYIVNKIRLKFAK
ncbi:MAG TPA: phosphatase PAP2 family protein [Patescibacteria group bacterium]|nr:phosphatase PAP2 family protein [Patescibacteria group bacterium]